MQQKTGPLNYQSYDCEVKHLTIVSINFYINDKSTEVYDR
jgi:hypothetical protein